MITEEDLVEAVCEQARLHPDRVYVAYLPPLGSNDVTCSYAPNELNPDCGCIVGDALAALGVPRPILERISDLGSWAVTPGAFSIYLGDRVDGGALRSVWVARVQHFQDEGECWARAVELADAEVAVR